MEEFKEGKLGGKWKWNLLEQDEGNEIRELLELLSLTLQSSPAAHMLQAAQPTTHIVSPQEFSIGPSTCDT